jgi:hypothetical protein
MEDAQGNRRKSSLRTLRKLALVVEGDPGVCKTDQKQQVNRLYRDYTNTCAACANFSKGRRGDALPEESEEICHAKARSGTHDVCSCSGVRDCGCERPAGFDMCGGKCVNASADAIDIAHLLGNQF